MLFETPSIEQLSRIIGSVAAPPFLLGAVAAFISMLIDALACRPELNLTVVQEARLGEETQVQQIGQPDIFQIGAWFLQRIV